MRTVLETALGNAALATLLALAIALLARRVRPAVAHALWLLVLVKLVTPPLVTLPVPGPWSRPPAVAVEPEPAPVARQDPPVAEVPGSPELVSVSGAETKLLTPEQLIGLEPLGSPAELAAAAAGAASAPKPVNPPKPAPEAVAPVTPASVPVAGPGRALGLAAARALVGPALVLLWLIGTVVWFVLVLRRVGRFRRLLDHARPADGALAEAVARLAKQVGLRRPPTVRLLPGSVPPLVWAATFRPIVLLPADLLARLDDARRDTLLLHELAHLKRGDHWVRRLEIVALGLYWWLPTIWWARREIQRAEEECCDGWVIDTLPGAARSYASALLDTIDFLSEPAALAPPVSSAVGQFPLLKRRLQQIVRGRARGRLPRPARLVLTALALALLPILPTLAKPTHPDPLAVAAPAQDVGEPDEPLLFDARAKDLQSSGPRTKFLAVAMSPDGRHLAAAGVDKIIRVWELPAGKQVAALTGHTDVVSALAYTPDGKSLVSGGYDRTVRTWDLTTRQLKRTLTGHHNWVYTVAVSPDGRTIASGSFDKTVRLWDMATGKLLQTLTGHTAAVRALAFAPDGRSLASGSADRTVRIWGLGDFQVMHTLKGHQGTVRALAYLEGGKLLASASEDRTIRLWDVQTGTERGMLGRHNEAIWSLAASAHGGTLASGSWDGQLRLWDVRNRRLLRSFSAHNDGVTGLAISPDGRWLASVGLDQQAKPWPEAKRPLSARVVLRGHTERVTAAVFSPDGRLIATASQDGTVCLWDRQGHKLRQLPAHKNGCLAVVFRPDSQRLATAGGDKIIRLWDPATGMELKKLTGHTKDAICLAFSPDGRTLASGGRDATVRLWDPTTGKEVRKFSAKADALVFGRDGQALFSGNEDGTITRWDVTGKAKPLVRRPRNGGTIAALALSPDGRTLAFALNGAINQPRQMVAPGAPGMVQTMSPGAANYVGFFTIDAANLTETARVLAHPDEIAGLAFAPGGQTVITACRDQQVRFWDRQSGAVRRSYRAHVAALSCLAVSPDGGDLLTGSDDRSAKLWDGSIGRLVSARAVLADGQGAATFAAWVGNTLVSSDGKHLRSRAACDLGRQPISFTGGFGRVMCLARSPDGKRIATGHEDHLVRLWDAATGRQLKVFKGHELPVWAVAFSPDGKALASSSGGLADEPERTGELRLWDVESGKSRTLDGGEVAEGVTWALAFAPDGRTLAEGGFDQKIRVWDVATGKVVRVLSGNNSMVRGLAFCPDGRLVSSGYDGTLRLWDVAAAKDVARYTLPERMFGPIAVAPDGHTVAAVLVPEDAAMGEKASVLLWDAAAARVKAKLLHQLPVNGIAFSADGKLLATVGGTPGQPGVVRLWDVASGQPVAELLGERGPAFACSFGRDGSLIVGGGEDGKAGELHLWLAAGAAVRERNCPIAVVMAVSPDGKLVAAADGAKVRLRDAASGREKLVLTGHTGPVRALVFAPDGRWLATAGADKSVRFWDVTTGKPARPALPASATTTPVFGVAVSADGQRLAICGGLDQKNAPGRVLLWDLKNDKPLGELAGLERIVRAVAFSPDGKRLATAQVGATSVRLWDVASRKELRWLNVTDARSVTFTPNSALVAMGTGAGVIRLYQAATGREVAVLNGHRGAVPRLAFAPDGRTLASAGADGTVRLWDVPEPGK